MPGTSPASARTVLRYCWCDSSCIVVGPGSTTWLVQSSVVIGPLVVGEPPLGMDVLPDPPLPGGPMPGDPLLLPIRFPVHAGSAKRSAAPARGMKLPGCLDLLTNDVVFPARKTLFLTLFSVGNGSPRDHSIT